MILALGALAVSFALPIAFYPLDKVLGLLYTFQEHLVSLAARAPGLEVSQVWPVLLLSLGISGGIIWWYRRAEAQRRRIGPFPG
jgi:hypothetical protein